MRDNILWFDLETTGLELTSSRIITCSFIFNGQEKTILVNPGVPIPESSSRVHGIKDVDVLGLPTLGYYAKSIYDVCCKCEFYGGHNLRKYDIVLLKIELLRFGYEIPNRPIIDTYEISQDLFKSLKLSDIYRTLTGKNFESHRSDADISATKELYEIIQNNYFK